MYREGMAENRGSEEMRAISIKPSQQETVLEADSDPGLGSRRIKGRWQKPWTVSDQGLSKGVIGHTSQVGRATMWQEVASDRRSIHTSEADGRGQGEGVTFRRRQRNSFSRKGQKARDAVKERLMMQAKQRQTTMSRRGLQDDPDLRRVKGAGESQPLELAVGSHPQGGIERGECSGEAGSCEARAERHEPQWSQAHDINEAAQSSQSQVQLREGLVEEGVNVS